MGKEERAERRIQSESVHSSPCCENLKRPTLFAARLGLRGRWVSDGVWHERFFARVLRERLTSMVLDPYKT